MTLVQLYRRTLERLQVVAAGEPAAPEDTQLVATRYVSLWNMLKVEGLVSWAVDEDVPREAEQSIVDALAFESAPEFGFPQAEFANGAIGLVPPSLSERRLRKMHARAYVSSPARSEYY